MCQFLRKLTEQVHWIWIICITRNHLLQKTMLFPLDCSVHVRFLYSYYQRLSFLENWQIFTYSFTHIIPWLHLDPQVHLCLLMTLKIWRPYSVPTPWNGQPPTGNLLCWLGGLLNSLKALMQLFLVFWASLLRQDLAFVFYIPNGNCFSHKVEKGLKDRFVSPKFPFLSLPPCPLTLLPNFHDFPLPETAVFPNSS